MDDAPASARCMGIIHISGPPFRYPKLAKATCMADLIPFQRFRRWKDRHVDRNLKSCHSMLEENVTKNIYANLATCPDPESFARGDPTLTMFFFFFFFFFFLMRGERV